MFFVKLGMTTSICCGAGIFLMTLLSFSQANAIERNCRRDFCCQRQDDIFITTVRTNVGIKPFIYWRLTDSQNNLTPEQRCQEGTRNLQAAQENQMLDQLFSDVYNGQPVICVARSSNGPCEHIILRLVSGTNHREVLLQLLDRRAIITGNGIDQNSRGRVYVDIQEYIDGIPTS